MGKRLFSCGDERCEVKKSAGDEAHNYLGLWCKKESIVVSKTSDFGSYPNGPASVFWRNGRNRFSSLV